MTWKPRTCRCYLEFRDGPEAPPTFLSRCAAHLECEPIDVWNENRGLNTAQGVLYEEHGMDPNDLVWSFPKTTGKRPLTLEVDIDLPERTLALLRTNKFNVIQPHKTKRRIRRLGEPVDRLAAGVDGEWDSLGVTVEANRHAGVTTLVRPVNVHEA